MSYFVVRRLVILAMIPGLVTVLAQDSGERWYQAIRSGDPTAIQTMVRTGSVNAKGRRGPTPLMYAAAIGNAEAVKLLLRAGADANASNDFGATALIWAAGDLRKVRLLLAYGADVNLRSKMGRTALMTAAANDGSLKITKLLVASGADISIKDQSQTPLLNTAAQAGNSAVVRYLLAHGASADSKDASGLTPLFWAAQHGNAELTGALLKRGADPRSVSAEPNDQVKNGTIELGRFGILHLTAAYGGPRAIGRVVEAGADVNAAEAWHGVTPLVRAIATDRPDMNTVRLLIAHGADPLRKPDDGWSAAEWAVKFRNPDVLAAFGLPTLPVNPAVVGARSNGGTNIRAAVERSLKLLQRTSAMFLEKGGCISCHAQNLTGMALGVARERHLTFDEKLAAAASQETSALLGAPEQLYLQLIDPPSGQGQDGTMYALLQLAAAGAPPSKATDAAVVYLAAAQHPDGSWRSLGIGRPPIEDASIFNTAMGLRSLRLYMLPARLPEFEERIERAAKWLQKEKPRSTPERAMQLLGLRWANRAAPAGRVRELLALQQADGGWAQTPYLQSDAYGTGLALYSLHYAGLDVADPAYQRGVRYLIDTEEPDGSWHVSSRSPKFQPYFESGFPHGQDQWISQAGTAWAAMALACAVPKTTAASLGGSR